MLHDEPNKEMKLVSNDLEGDLMFNRGTSLTANLKRMGAVKTKKPEITQFN